MSVLKNPQITQRALRKLEIQPILLCRGVKPDSAEWFAYLQLDPHLDADLTWVVQLPRLDRVQQGHELARHR